MGRKKMKKIRFFFIVLLPFFYSCSTNYSSEEIITAYCQCVELPQVKKTRCVSEWATKYNARYSTPEELKQLIYSMIECNGFEGENDFNLKLKK